MADIPPLRPISNVSDGSEVISTFEVVASGLGQSNIQTLKPINNKLVNVSPTAKSQISTPPANITQKVKFVTSNQFVHIKPPPLNTKKIYMKTPKTSANAQQSITFRVAPTTDGKTPSGNRLITVKGKSVGQQILTATSFDNRLVQQPLRGSANTTATVSASPGHKFTLVKQASTPQTVPIPTQTIATPSTIVKASVPISVPASSTTIAANTSSTSDSDLMNTSILDLPILFADSDGNIEDNQQSETKEAAFPSPAPTTNYIVIASQPSGIKSTMLSNRSVFVNSLTPTNTLTKVTSASQSNKYVVINRGQFKPGTTTSVMTTNRAMQPIKYSKVMIPSSDIITTTTAKTLVTAAAGTFTPGTLTPGTKIDISNLVKTGTVTTRGAAGVATATTSSKPIIINIDSEKSTFKNVIKIPSSEVPLMKANTTPSNSIVLKQGDVRTVSNMGTVTGVGTMPVIKGGILNRNITVISHDHSRSYVLKTKKKSKFIETLFSFIAGPQN